MLNQYSLRITHTPPHRIRQTKQATMEDTTTVTKDTSHQDVKVVQTIVSPQESRADNETKTIHPVWSFYFVLKYLLCSFVIIYMNKKIITTTLIVAIALLGLSIYANYKSPNETTIKTPPKDEVSITYKNTEYGFDFSLPVDWQGYTINKSTWTGYPLNKSDAQSGAKLLIRNPQWTTAAPYEDLPILVFTIEQWNSYTKEDFSISAAPIPATELGRNNKYVFALPPRWDFDYSLGVEQAQDIIKGKPLQPFNI